MDAPVLSVEHIVLTYGKDCKQLMHELKNIGAHNVNKGRRKTLTGKQRLNKVISHYETFRADNKLPATYEVIYGHAWRPHRQRGKSTTENSQSISLDQLRQGPQGQKAKVVMSKGVFITGTDTGVGKTWFTLALIEALKEQGRKTNGMKPIASGGNYVNGKLMNDDARLIMQCSSELVDYELINPYVFEPSVSPNFAARRAGVFVEIDQIVASYNHLASACDNIIVEGVGGWRVPMSDEIGTADLVRELEYARHLWWLACA